MPTLINRFDTPASTLNWQAINDGVMGGVSVSRMRFDLAGHAVFEGEVSLENNGALPHCGHRRLTWDVLTPWPIV